LEIQNNFVEKKSCHSRLDSFAPKHYFDAGLKKGADTKYCGRTFGYIQNVGYQDGNDESKRGLRKC
jgi:hypothetical protein